MGEGQGLHEIVPKLAKSLSGRTIFRLIGDGGRRAELEKRLVEVGCENVEILNPVTRGQLLVAYQNADILFLLLNDYVAFKKVLPSKLFEYAATGKPILAGVSGYAASFVRSEIDGATVFSPCNVMEAEQAFSSLTKNSVDRSKFIKKYSRANIMKLMAIDILSRANEGT
jgi:glycosyltransferase involved in cell wall biosynthesis